MLGDLQKVGILDTPQKLRIKSLRQFIEKELGGKAKEIILATNLTTYGDINASIIAGSLARWPASETNRSFEFAKFAEFAEFSGFDLARA